MNKTLQQKFLAGSTPIPNWIFDEVMADMPDSVLRVFLYMFRKTVGWDNKSEEKSLTQIERDCNLSRHTAIYAVKVLCDCWGMWTKFRGKKGQRSSVYLVSGLYNKDEVQARIVLTEMIYGYDCPTDKQLKDNPPTEELYRAALASGISKHGDDWWVAKASTQWCSDCTTSGAVVALGAGQ